MAMTKDEWKAELFHKLKMAEDPDYRATFIHQTVTDAMQPGREFYPYSPEAIGEALCELTKENLEDLSEKMTHPQVDFYFLRGLIYSYWYTTASTIVGRRFE